MEPQPAEPDEYHFGDVLARARQSWVNEMARRLAVGGYSDYRRSDAATMRILARGPVAIGVLGAALGVTRQAARKAAERLEAQGLASMQRDEWDGRQTNVVLTSAGHRYAAAVVAAVDEMNAEVRDRLPSDQLVAVDAALRAVIFDEDLRQLTDLLAPPPRPVDVTPDRRE